MAVTETGHAAGRALDELYRRHGSQVYRYALGVLGNHADAEDVTQTTFLNAYRSIEQGVRPRKPANWLLTIASNAIKQGFRQKQARPLEVALNQELTDTGHDEEGPTIEELLAALSRIPPQQRQAIVLREFEGRSYAEIAQILEVTTSALETLLFRARRSLAEELKHRLTCTDAQLAVSRAADGRLGRKDRRRLCEHLAECPDCAHFATVQKRHRRALRGLGVVPVPVSLSLLHEIQSSAAAVVLPVGASAAAAGTGSAAMTAGGSTLAGGLVLKAAAVAAAATVVGGVTVTGGSELPIRTGHDSPPPARSVPRAHVNGRSAGSNRAAPTAQGAASARIQMPRAAGKRIANEAPGRRTGATRGPRRGESAERRSNIAPATGRSATKSLLGARTSSSRGGQGAVPAKTASGLKASLVKQSPATEPARGVNRRSATHSDAAATP